MSMLDDILESLKYAPPGSGAQAPPRPRINVPVPLAQPQPQPGAGDAARVQNVGPFRAIRKGVDYDNTQPVVKDFISKVQERFPGIEITSGYRDAKYNRSVGGAGGSQHIKGLAFDADLRKLSPAEKGAVIDFARANGATGLGNYGGDSIHIDFRKGAPVAWGPDYHSATLGQTQPWFRQRAYDHMAGKQPAPVPPGNVPNTQVAASQPPAAQAAPASPQPRAYAPANAGPQSTAPAQQAIQRAAPGSTERMSAPTSKPQPATSSPPARSRAAPVPAATGVGGLGQALSGFFGGGGAQAMQRSHGPEGGMMSADPLGARGSGSASQRSAQAPAARPGAAGASPIPLPPIRPGTVSEMPMPQGRPDNLGAITNPPLPQSNPRFDLAPPAGVALPPPNPRFDLAPPALAALPKANPRFELAPEEAGNTLAGQSPPSPADIARAHHPASLSPFDKTPIGLRGDMMAPAVVPDASTIFAQPDRYSSPPAPTPAAPPEADLFLGPSVFAPNTAMPGIAPQQAMPWSPFAPNTDLTGIAPPQLDWEWPTNFASWE